METLKIQSGQGDYKVNFLDEVAQLENQLAIFPKRVVLIDKRVAGLYHPDLKELGCVLEIIAEEKSKTFPAGIHSVLSFLQQNKVQKNVVIIAIGGGVIQDIATFVSHIYYRGLDWIYVPTTLLGMADSCIGAKCGINLGAFKNQLGVFHSPKHIWICSEFLKTLERVDLFSGFGEVIKLALTSGKPDFFNWLEKSLIKSPLTEAPLLEFVYKSLEVKKAVIEQDEYESDLRRVLNYGHTYGHALEAITHYEIPHGLAVVWGIDLVNWISVKKGFLSQKKFEQIHQFIQRNYRINSSKPVWLTQLVAASKTDKKMIDGQLNLVLLHDDWKLRVHQILDSSELEASILEYLHCQNVLSCD